MIKTLAVGLMLLSQNLLAQTDQRQEIQATQLNNVAVSVVYDSKNANCPQPQETRVKWLYSLNEKVYVKAVTLAIINHEKQIELRNIMNTDSMIFDETNNQFEYTFCAAPRWTHSYQTKVLDPTTGKVSRNITVNVSVPIR